MQGSGPLCAIPAVPVLRGPVMGGAAITTCAHSDKLPGTMRAPMLTC